MKQITQIVVKLMRSKTGSFKLDLKPNKSSHEVLVLNHSLFACYRSLWLQFYSSPSLYESYETFLKIVMETINSFPEQILNTFQNKVFLSTKFVSGGPEPFGKT